MKPSGISSNVKHLSLSSAGSSEDLVRRFKNLYAELAHHNCQSNLLDQIYREDLVFQDSFHRIEGLQPFKNYCQALYENLTSCKFDFDKQWLGQRDAMLTWTLNYTHPKLNGGKLIRVRGATELQFDQKVFAHHDYFDGGQLLYEHVPLLSSVIKQLKKRMVS